MNKYPANINPAAVQLLNEFSNRVSNLAVLELGCSFGTLGKYFCENNNTKQIDWIGIDYNKEAVEIAKSQLNDAFCFDLNNVTLTQLRCIKNVINPDIILMIDTLEHLMNPEQILSQLLIVFPQTPLLIILPNISCLTIIDQLSKCEFNYTQHGILDFTHLKHFTPISAIKFLGKYGYKVEKKPLFLGEPRLKSYASVTTFPSEIKYSNLLLHVESQEQLETLISFGFGLIATPQ